jgi:Phospholipase_D-nuclease N-terminal
MTSILIAQLNEPETFFGAAAGLMILFWVIGLVATVFWLWMLIDALVYEPSTEQKILWFLVIFFLSIVGAIIYFVVRKGSGARGRPVG